MSWSYYVELRVPAERALDMLTASGEMPAAMIQLTPQFIMRCVIGLLCICKVSVERIVEFFDEVFHYHVSKGKIGSIQEIARRNIEEIEQEIPLDNIRFVAMDEIFQQRNPVLATVDLETQYIPMMQLEKSRTAETWERALNQEKVYGFNPEVCVSDAASGLIKGVTSAFPGITMQLDVFHSLRDVGVHVTRQENRAISDLSELFDLESRLKKPKARQTTQKRYEELSATIDETLQKTDTLCILYAWLKELTGFSGYGYAKSLSLCTWIIDEMAVLFPDKKKYQKALMLSRKRLPDILHFLRRLQDNFQEASSALHMDAHDLMLLYNQTAYSINSEEYQAIEKRLFHKLGKRIIDAREALPDIIHMTFRASSMIENVNSRIRCYMDLKREIPEKFLVLLKFYMNTRKAVRPTNKDWTGTSALDRLTGHDNPSFLDMLFGSPDYIVGA